MSIAWGNTLQLGNNALWFDLREIWQHCWKNDSRNTWKIKSDFRARVARNLFDSTAKQNRISSIMRNSATLPNENSCQVFMKYWNETHLRLDNYILLTVSFCCTRYDLATLHVDCHESNLTTLLRNETLQFTWDLIDDASRVMLKAKKFFNLITSLAI